MSTRHARTSAKLRPFLYVSEGAWYEIEGAAPPGEYGTDWLVIEATSGPEAVALLESDRLDVRPLSERAARELFEVAS